MKIKYPFWVLLAVLLAGPAFAQISQKTYKNVVIKLCPPNMMGCAQRAVAEGKEVLLDPVTEEARVKYNDLINRCKKRGLLQTPRVTVQGFVVKEKGHFPNPMAKFDVLKINDLK